MKSIRVLCVILALMLTVVGCERELTQSPKQGHYIAITGISVLSRGLQDYTVPVVVNIENQGDCGESFDVKLIDVTDGKQIGTKPVTLSPAGEGGMDELCDMTFSPPASGRNNFGDAVSCGHDVNGDGYHDLLIEGSMWVGNESQRGWKSPFYDISKYYRYYGQGRVYLYYGGPDMDENPDKIFTGEKVGDRFGDQGCVLGDVNNDNFADVIVGAVGHNNYQGKVYIYFGGPDMDENADLILEGEKVERDWFGYRVDAADIDNDGYDDVLVTAPSDRGPGRAYLFHGGDPMDTTCDNIFYGENFRDYFGHTGIIGGDVDGDNYKDVLIGTRYFPAGKNQGRAYLYYGDKRGDMNKIPDLVFVCPIEGIDEFGSSLGINDINGDGYAEVVIGSRAYNNSQGRVYLYWGNDRTNMNATPDKIFDGEKGASLGGDRLCCDDFNNDNFGDILVGAYSWYGAQGRAYLYYGGTKTSMDETPDKIFTGEVPGSCFGDEVGVADFNNDNYPDIVIGGWKYNDMQGRVWLYYNNPPSLTNVTFYWDTTRANRGEHTLTAIVSPIRGEKDIADNTVLKKINLKDRP